jgi:hypothetical protein
MIHKLVRAWVQASGDVQVLVSQGPDQATITYTQGCQGVACAWTRAEHSRVTLPRGCSLISITFTDQGELFKWLHVSARYVSSQCTGDPEYSSCNATVTAFRRLAAAAPESNVTALLPEIVEEELTDTVGRGPGRKLLVPFSQGLGDPRVVTLNQIQLQGTENDDSPLAAPYQSNQEDCPVSDIDASIDLSCSIFKVLCLYCPPERLRSSIASGM